MTVSPSSVVTAGAAAVLLSLPACADAGREAPESEGAGPEEWRMTQLARIGSVSDADVGFTEVDQVLIGPDERLYVPESTEMEIRVYGLDGSLMDTYGREGEGPEEFGMLGAVGMFGDTLYVYDRARYRVQTLSTTGGFGRAWSWRVEPIVKEGHFLYVSGSSPRLVLRDDGSAVAHLGIGIMTEMPDPFHLPVVRVDREARIRDTIAFEDVRQVAVRVEHQGGAPSFRTPFPDVPMLTLMPDSSGVVFVDRAVRPDAVSPAYSVTHIGDSGDTTFVTSMPYEPQPLANEAILRALRDEYPPDDPAAPPEGMIVDALRDADLLPPTVPPVSDVAAGQDGSIWIAREATGDVRRWEVLDGTGTWTGRVRLPTSQSVIAARGTLVVVLETDELDVPWLVAYRVER